MVENRTIDKKVGTVLSQAFRRGTLHVRVRQCLQFRSNTPDESQKAVARNLAAFGAILCFFLGQPACLYSMVYRFVVGTKLRIPVSTRVQTALTFLSPL